MEPDFETLDPSDGGRFRLDDRPLAMPDIPEADLQALTASQALRWAPPGPIAKQFVQSRAFQQIIIGPIGSGKTVAAYMKLVGFSMLQEPDNTGTRRTFWAICKDSYPNLWRTAIPDWQAWFKPEITRGWSGGKDGPAYHRLRWMHPTGDGTMCDMLVAFVALGSQMTSMEQLVRGFNVTGFLLEEGDLLPDDALDKCSGRAGRFPPSNRRYIELKALNRHWELPVEEWKPGPSWHGVIVTCNAPRFGNYILKRIARKNAQGNLDVFWQPGGMEPNAENLNHLPPNYYENQLASKSEADAARMVHNKPGVARDSMAVYKNFAYRVHVVEGVIPPVTGLPIYIGLDGGRRPAAVFFQRPALQYRVLAELCRTGVGPTSFGREVSEFCAAQWGSEFTFEAACDPADGMGGDENDPTWRIRFAEASGIPTRPSPHNNKIGPRLEAVENTLSEIYDGEVAFRISDRCERLIAGFLWGYRFRAIRKSDGLGEGLTTTPDKNEYSHPHDALQNGIMAFSDATQVTHRRGSSPFRGRVFAGPTPLRFVT